jgi:hypothetical protein
LVPEPKILPQPIRGNNAAITMQLRLNLVCKMFFPGQIWRAGLHNDESGGGQL